MTITVVLILVQQRSLLTRVRRLNDQLAWLYYSIVRLQALHRLQIALKGVDYASVHLCSAISAYSRRWSAFLSTTLPVQTFGVAYFFYGLVFREEEVSPGLKTMFASGIFNLTSTIFMQTSLCAQVARYSAAYAKKFELLSWRLGKLRRLSPAEELKWQSSAQQRGEFAFKFLDYRTINSSTFPKVKLTFF